MGTLVAAMATSHAFAVIDPSRWDEFRRLNRQLYQRLYGDEPPVAPEVDRETPEAVRSRYAQVSGAHDRLAAELAQRRPDVLLVVGDDQNELYHLENIPQIAIYNGGDFRTTADGKPYTSHSEIADILLARLLRENFDVSFSSKLPEGRRISHAHADVLDRLVPDRDIPIVPIFVNGIHVPALEPRRCHALGAALRRIVEQGLPADTRVAAVASGGLSHFSARYPWRAYHGPYHHGAIDVDFDRRLIAAMSRGEGARLAAELGSDDLLAHGEIEFRCWLVVLGMVDDAPAEMLAYEPLYRAMMGMAVGRWQLQ